MMRLGMRAAMLLTAATTILLLVGCGHESGHTEAVPETVPVRVASSTLRGGVATVVLPGTVRPRLEATLASRIMGQVKRKLTAAGRKVQRGDILLRMDDRSVRGQVAQAEGALAQATAALSFARANLDRYTELYERHAASELEMDMARTRHAQALGAVEQAEGAVSAAESLLDDVELRAPFTGIVVDVMVKEGDLCAPGMPLLRMMDPDSMQLIVDVRESEKDTLLAADRIVARFPAAGSIETAARVAEVVSAADPNTHTFRVHLDLDPLPGITAGMFGRAIFYTTNDGKGRIFVPRSALVRRGQLAMVFTIEQGRAVMHMVKEGRVEGDRVELIRGLDAGVDVVTENAGILAHGTPVRVMP